MQQKKQSALKKSDKDLIAILELMPVPAMIHVDGVIKFLNHGACDLFAVKNPTIVVGQSVLTFVIEEDRDKVTRRLEQLKSGKDVFNPFSFNFLDATGKEKTIEIKSTKVHFLGEESSLIMAQNVTRRRELEQELTIKNLLIEKITQTIPDSIYITDITTYKNTYIHNDLIKRLGYDLSEIENQIQFLFSIVHKDDIADLKVAIDSIQHTMDDKQFVGANFRLKDPKGNYIWFFGRSRVFKRNIYGKPLQYFSITQDITEQKKIEAELKENQLLTAKITTTIPHMIVVLNIRTNEIVYSNLSNRRFLGYTQKDFQKGFAKYLSAQTKKEFSSYIDKISHLGDGKFANQEFQIIDRKGRNRWIMTRANIFRRDENRSPSEVLFTIIDRTKEKEFEVRLLRSEKIYRTIAKSIPDTSVVVFDKELKFMLADGPLLKKQKLKKSFIEGSNAYDTLPNGQNWNYFIPLFKRVLKGETLTLEIPVKDFVYLINILPLKSEDGEIYGGMSITMDIREIRVTKEQLERTEKTKLAIVESIPDLIFILDKKGNYLEFFPSHDMDPRFPPLEFIGKNVDEIMPKRLSGKVKKFLKLAVETKEVQTFEYKWPVADQRNSIYFEARLYALGSNEVMAIVRNITELKNAQKTVTSKLKEISDKNKELEKYITSNIELEKYAFITSHDLKEPLRNIIGFSQLLQRRYGGTIDQDADEYISHIIAGTKRMEVLIKGLLAFSRVESRGNPFEKNDLKEILNKVMDDLKSQVDESKATVRFDKLPKIMCDALQIRQLFQNLISNAIKFEKENNNPIITIKSKKEDDCYLFSFTDNGVGLDMRYQKKIFEIFQRLYAHDKYSGAGIGLAICKKIVDRHNGEIWVQSKLGEGSTFYVKLPIINKSRR